MDKVMGSKLLIISNSCEQTDADDVGHGTQPRLYTSGIEGSTEATEGVYGN